MHWLGHGVQGTRVDNRAVFEGLGLCTGPAPSRGCSTKWGR